MTYPSINDVERAVKSILRERSLPERTGNHHAEVFAEKLLSLKHAESLTWGVHEIRVAPGTVITPLARDYLKRQGVGLKVISRSEIARVRDRGEWGFAIDTESGVISALRRALLDDATPWIELESGSEAAARWVAESVGRGALMVADEASVAVWRASRQPGVRAASVHNVDSVARAVRRLGANLLVVEPLGKSISEMKQMSLAFRNSGAPRLPAGLE